MGALGGKKLAIVGSSFTNKTEEKFSPNNIFFCESGNIYFKNSRQIKKKSRLGRNICKLLFCCRAIPDGELLIGKQKTLLLKLKFLLIPFSFQ